MNLSAEPASLYSVPLTSMSWNTSHSRTFTSSLDSASFSAPVDVRIQGLQDVHGVLQAVRLKLCPQGTLTGHEFVGQGETFYVEKCVMANDKEVVAVKHLKLNQATSSNNTRDFERRLRSVILELRIMHHPPLHNHPNILKLIGYGWNTQRNQILPYIVVEHSPFGTLRMYLHDQKTLSLSCKEILIGDVAAGLHALHLSGIVHGDVKLENVLVFPSLERPAAAIAKLCDFGHSLILKGCEESTSLPYRGTLRYDAPETLSQAQNPIELERLHKADVWSFGLLAWEVLLDGIFFHELQNVPKFTRCEEPRNQLLKFAKASVKLSGDTLQRAILLGVLNLTLQDDPDARISDLTKLPIMAKWHSDPRIALEASLALHSGSSDWNFNTFRLDQGREILWNHQQHMFQDFERFQRVSTKDVETAAKSAWQMAICYTIGFGVDKDPIAAMRWTEFAASNGQQSAKFMATVPHKQASVLREKLRANYLTFIRQSLRQSLEKSQDFPRDQDECFSLFKACCLGQSAHVKGMLLKDRKRDVKALRWPAEEGTSLHWLFMLDPETQNAIASEGSNGSKHIGDLPKRRIHSLPVDKIRSKVYIPERQWPLQLAGTPLAIAVSVGDLSTVRVLLSIGADPWAQAFDPEQFGTDRHHQAQWNSVHLAIKNHDADILKELISNTKELPDGIAYALSFSSLLERTALHGPWQEEQLIKTIQHLGGSTALESSTAEGVTPLMQAIDFHDAAVARAILDVAPFLCVKRFSKPDNPESFTLPFVFAAQIAARRDSSDSTELMKILYGKSNTVLEHRDGDGRTALHMAVTGSSTRASIFLLDKLPNLLETVDRSGRSPLFYCSSDTLCEMLISRGANLDRVDSKGFTAIHQAVFNGHTAVVQRLCSERVHIGIKQGVFGTPLHCAALKKDKEVSMILLEANTDKSFVNAKNSEGNTALHLATREGSSALVKLLLEHGAELDSKNSRQETPFSISICYGNFSVFECLAGPADNLVPLPHVPLDSEGHTALHLAAHNGRLYFAKRLLENASHEVSLSSLNNHKRQTPLHLAAEQRQHEVCRLFLAHDSSSGEILKLVNARDCDGNTAVHFAVRGPPNGKISQINDCLDTLSAITAIDVNVDLTAVNNSGELPWDIAGRGDGWSASHKSGIFYFLLANGGLQACRNLKNKNGEDVGDVLMSVAIKSKNAELCRQLVQTRLVSVDGLHPVFSLRNADPDSPSLAAIEAWFQTSYWGNRWSENMNPGFEVDEKEVDVNKEAPPGGKVRRRNQSPRANIYGSVGDKRRP